MKCCHVLCCTGWLVVGLLVTSCVAGHSFVSGRQITEPGRDLSRTFGAERALLKNGISEWTYYFEAIGKFRDVD